MRERCRSWSGWNCEQLPADSAVVLRLDGTPPESFFPAEPAAGWVEVLFCRQGGLRVELSAGRGLAMRSGQVLFLPAWVSGCQCRFFPERFQGILVLETDQNLRAALAALCPGLPGTPPDRHHGSGVVEAALWSKSLFHTLDRLPEPLQGNYCSLKALELLYLLHAGIPSVSNPIEAQYYDPYQTRTVEKIHDYLMEHLDEQLTIPQLAERFRVSGTMLKACFRQIYGTSLHQYLLERRMERAAELLLRTNQPEIQVAAAVGYNSTSQFGSTFKARYQMTPAQYRKAAKMSVSVGFCPKPKEKLAPNLL